MGLDVNVYRNNHGDCTINGISKDHDSLCLINVDGPFEPDDKCPAAVLVEHAGHAVVRPASSLTDKEWYMFGGNYAGCSDSRFRKAVEKITGHYFYGAVPIHDRNEG